MKTIHRHLLTAGLLAAFGLGAVAQTQTPPAPPAGGAQAMQGQRGMHGQDRMEHRRARMQERLAKRLGHLKASCASPRPRKAPGPPGPPSCSRPASACSVRTAPSSPA